MTCLLQIGNQFWSMLLKEHENVSSISSILFSALSCSIPVCACACVSISLSIYICVCVNIFIFVCDCLSFCVCFVCLSIRPPMMTVLSRRFFVLLLKGLFCMCVIIQITITLQYSAIQYNIIYIILKNAIQYHTIHHHCKTELIIP